MLLVTGLPLLTAGIAMLMDIKDTRIDNGWLLFMLSVSFAMKIIQEGVAGIGMFILGAGVPFIMLFWLHIFHMLGAGDIKLLCVLGSMIGPRKIGTGIIYILGIGAVLSLFILLFYADLGKRLRYLWQYISVSIAKKEIQPYYRSGMELENIHFTVPVFLGMVLYAGGIF